MNIEGLASRKFFIAVRANKRLGTDAKFLVSFKVFFCEQDLATLFTLMLTLVVYQHMIRESSFSSETSIAVLATKLVWLMRFHMQLQYTLLNKSFATRLTLVGPFTHF
jgi:hypothetical protein